VIHCRCSLGPRAGRRPCPDSQAFRPPRKPRGWSTERRTSLSVLPHSKRGLRAPPGAPSRLFCPWDRASGCPTGPFGALIRQAFARLRQHRVQLFKAAPVVGAGSRPPECGVTSPARGRRIRLHHRTSREDALDKQDGTRIQSLGILSRDATCHSRESKTKNRARNLGFRPKFSVKFESSMELFKKFLGGMTPPFNITARGSS
jgi:hypothetical protein